VAYYIGSHPVHVRFEQSGPNFADVQNQPTIRSPGLTFNGLRPRSPRNYSLPGWLIYSVQFAREVVTCQP